jgi:hypothetical protein
MGMWPETSDRSIAVRLTSSEAVGDAFVPIVQNRFALIGVNVMTMSLKPALKMDRIPPGLFTFIQELVDECGVIHCC